MIYLLHYDKPLESRPGVKVRHYIGYTRNMETLAWRLAAHKRGRTGSDGGANITKAFCEIGAKFVMARVWEGGRKMERKAKQQKNARLLCPICNPGAYRRLWEGTIIDEEKREDS